MNLPENRKNFIFGENIINSIAQALPRVFFPDKRLYPIQEDLIYKHFPIGTTDTSDSPYFYAYLDFGYAGLFIYPLLLACMWWLVLMIFHLPYISAVGALVLACTWIPLFTISLGESAITGYIVTLRNSILVLPFLMVFSSYLRIPPSPLAKNVIFTKK